MSEAPIYLDNNATTMVDEAVVADMLPFLTEQVGALFLPWSDANAKALAAGEESFEVELAGRVWE
ncbi:MAG: hypothetical protein ACPG4N_09715, partial [Gammaproteobacteria bacterium]